MTTESSVDANPGPAAGSERPAIEQIRPLRLPAALTLLLVNLFWLLISVERFLIPQERLDPVPGFAERARTSFDDFAGLAPILLPLVAVFLVTYIAPVVAEAKLLLVAALSEYALAGLFAVIAFLSGFLAPGHSGRTIVEDAFTGLGSLILLGLATLVVVRITQALFREPKPDRFAAYGRGAGAAEPVTAPPANTVPPPGAAPPANTVPPPGAAPPPNTAPLPPHYAAPPQGSPYGYQPHGVSHPPRTPDPETPDQ